MTDSTAFGTFFLPGPTEVRPEILAAMVRPMIAHRSSAFEALFARLQTGLRALFRTSRPVYVSSSSATGLMEGAVRCAPDGPLLCLVGGAFGDRFYRIAQRCGREADTIKVPLGETFDLDEVRRHLAARQYAAVTVVHSESSTGVLTDVATVAAMAREHGAMSIVDAVTSMGACRVETDAWGLDFVLTGSQKALALPPGLAFGVASPAFASSARDAAGRGMYFDLAEFDDFAVKGQTPNTPALPLFYALEAQLETIAAEGIEARWARHQAMRERTEAWVAERESDLPGIRMLAPAGSRSPTVSAIALPDDVEGKALVKAVAARGFTIGGGYGALAGSTIRIGHMGDHSLGTLERCLAACTEAVALTHSSR